MSMIVIDDKIISQLRDEFRKGDRVTLGMMDCEDSEMFPCGLQGTVYCVDDDGLIQVDWDNGEDMPLSVQCDLFARGELTVEEMFPKSYLEH